MKQWQMKRKDVVQKGNQLFDKKTNAKAYCIDWLKNKFKKKVVLY